MPSGLPSTAASLACVLALGLGPAPPARATEAGGGAQVACRETAGFQVASRDRADAPGADIVVTPKRPGGSALPCAMRRDGGAFAVAEHEDATVLALGDRFLALDAGTGPDRRLLIYDLASRRKAVDVPYDDARFTAATDAFAYWQVGARIRGGACLARYGRLHDLPRPVRGHALREVRFRFADGAPRDTGRADCTVTQADMT